jgi:hypothetical protein
MNGRQLLAVGAVTLALAGIVWYAVGAPSRGSAVEPGAATDVQLEVTAAGTGNWVRYLVTVQNVGNLTFKGDVLLLDTQGQSNALAGRPISSFPQNPRVPTPPEVAAQPGYRVHLTVPAGKSRTVAVTAPDSFNYAQVLNGSQVITEAEVQRSVVLPVAVLSDIETAAQAIGGLQFDRIVPRVAAFGTTRGFPSSSLLLATYATVVITQVDTAALSAVQLQALRDFIGLGGTLVVTGGADWRRTLAPLPSDLLPIAPRWTTTVSLAPLAQLAGTSVADLQVPAAAGALKQGARNLLSSPDGFSIASELDYGAGRVIELAFDPASVPVAGSRYAALAWNQALARSLADLPGSTPAAPTLLPPDPQFTAFLPVAADAPLPSPLLVGLVLALYVLVAGPLNYFLVYRRLRQPALLWLTAPLSAAFFTAIFYAAGSTLQGGLQDHEIQVLKVGPGQVMNQLEYHRILFLQRGNHRITPAPDTLVAPLTLDTYRTTGSTCERCTLQLQGLTQGSERVLPGQQPAVDESGVVYGSVRVVASSGVTHTAAGLDSHLSVKGGRLHGTVKNLSRAPIADLTLFTTDGDTVRKADLASLLPPGRTLEVDVPVQTEATPATSASQRVLRSTALGVLASGAGPVLTGLTAPARSTLAVDGRPPPLSGIAILQQPVRLEAADDLLRYFEQRRLASSTGEAGVGFQDVYDVMIPDSSKPLKLIFNHDLSAQFEVYDFSQGQFQPVQSDSTDVLVSVPLSSSQVSSGMVRVRFREARLFQGSGLWVDVADATNP